LNWSIVHNGEENKKLVNDGKFDEAKEIGKKFPFEKGLMIPSLKRNNSNIVCYYPMCAT